MTHDRAVRAWLDRRARFVGRRLWAFAYPIRGRGLAPLRLVAMRAYVALLRCDLLLWRFFWRLTYGPQS